MAAKIYFVICASALLQTILAQCIGTFNPGLLSYGNVGGCSSGLAAPYSSGGGLSTSSASPIAANGVSVLSNNGIEGCLDVCGQLPFLGTVGLEGQVPSSGSAGVSYSCGDSNVGISSQSLSAAGYGNNYGLSSMTGLNQQCGCGAGISSVAQGLNIAGLGYGAGLSAAGLGYGAGLNAAGLGYGAGLNAAGLGYGAGLGAACGGYGGVGSGLVGVAGDLDVAGNTLLAGSVPVLGAVSYGGSVPAAGSVTISGNCGCGCTYGGI